MDVHLTRNRIMLSNKFWYFRFGLKQNDTEEDPGITQRWFETGIPEGFEKKKIYVPSAWNMYENRKDFYHFGTGWYETEFYVSEAWGASDGSKVSLVFSGSNYKTTVWVNGQLVGSHEGGYTKFWFEISPFVKFGSENKLVIQVDNRYQTERIPWFKASNWMNYGGIYRIAYLKLTPNICLGDYKITNEITFDKSVGEGYQSPKAILNVRCKVQDNRPEYAQGFKGTLLMTVKDSDSYEVFEVAAKVGKNGEDIIEGQVKMDKVKLWSPDFPHLYSITFQLIDQDRHEIDRETCQWGFKEFKIRENQFLLNNSPIVLCGINRQEDHPDVGSSISPRQIYNDLNILKEANINCIRTSHFPPYEATLEFADEMGFLVIEDTPIHQLSKEHFTTPFLINAQKQLWEMIHRDKNHTSVIAWSLGNECETDCEEGKEFFKSLFDIAKELDPTRYLTYVTNRPLTDKVMCMGDFVCSNVYVGWLNNYDVPPSDVAKVFDQIAEKLKAEFGNKMKPMIISEFGAESISGYKSFSTTHWSETYQYELLRTYFEIMIKKGIFAGAIVSNFCDYRVSPYESFKDQPREYNNMGICDMNRNPKIAYYIVQSQFKHWIAALKKNA